MCMATSNFLPTAQFGVFVTLSVLIALFLDILIDPLLLKMLMPSRPAAVAVEANEVPIAERRLQP